MKKIIIFMFILYFMLSESVLAKGDLKVYLFDELVNMDNPVIINGNTLVPLRVLFESLGSTVSWDDSSRTVNAIKGNVKLSIQIGSSEVFKNDEKIEIEEPAQIINEKTYVPLRFVAESFNQNVRWDGDNNSIYIGKSLNAKEISKLSSPSVVYIEVYDANNKFFKSGSGFIIDKSGVIITNYHVIDSAFRVNIRMIDGSSLNVTKIINYDKNNDIAILKVETKKDLPIVTIGNSDNVENGEKVFAIGSPQGFENTISEGIVSNKNQQFLNKRQIQITAQITHGSSGGALFNAKGEVIGITDAGLGEADLNFAIPINDIEHLLKTDKSLSFQNVFNNEHVIVFSDSTYTGTIDKNQPNGFGILEYNFGDRYVGEFVNGFFSGKGLYTWKNGASYDGEWLNGFRQGRGKLIDQSGNICDCEFSNNKANGKGILYFVNGDMYIGEFLNDALNGYGTYTYANGQFKKGYWSNSVFLN